MRGRVFVVMLLGLSIVIAACGNPDSAGSSSSSGSTYGKAGARFTVDFSSIPESGPPPSPPAGAPNPCPPTATGTDWWAGSSTDPQVTITNSSTQPSFAYDEVTVWQLPTASAALQAYTNMRRSFTSIGASHFNIRGPRGTLALQLSMPQNGTGYETLDAVELGESLFIVVGWSPNSESQTKAFADSFSLPRSDTGFAAAPPITGSASQASQTRRSGLATSIPAGALGPFVGYNWFGSPRTVSAELRVPTIVRRSQSVVAASTWIGVQSEAGGFVQIGTLEASVNGTTAYEGFWSDDTDEFHPQCFGAVHPGDVVAVSITAARGGWRLTFRDGGGLTFTQSVNMINVGFNEAEWLQEDPTEAFSPQPYPDLESVAFKNLRVNGEAPRLTLTNAEWMSVPGRDFAPTNLVHDSFTVVSAHVDAEQANFLRVIAPYEIAARRFDNIEGTWRANPPTSTAAMSVLKPFLASLTSVDQVLAMRSWPGVSRGDVDALIKSRVLDARALSALAKAEPNPSSAVVAQVVQARLALKAADNRLNGDLHLPG